MMSKKEEVKKIEKHDTVFNSLMEIFKSAPYNETFTERRTIVLHANPSEKNAGTYTFTHNGNGVGVLKTSDARLRADFQITMNDNAAISNADGVNMPNGNPSMSVFVPPPLPLRLIWRSKELKINDNLVTLADNFSHITSYIRFLTRDGTKRDWSDAKEINGAFFDTSGHFDSILGFNDNAGATNLGGLERYQQFRNVGGVMPTKHFIDEVDVTCFSESGNESFLPSALKLCLTLTRADNKVVCMGNSRGNNADPSVVQQDFNNMQLNITNFELHIPVYKPNDQLMDALNKMLGGEQSESTYYTSEFRCITQSSAVGKRNHQTVDVFNGSTPTRMYIAIIRQDNWNGTVPSTGGLNAQTTDVNNTNAFRFRWENISHCQVDINSTNWGEPLKNSKQAYEQLRHVLNRVYRDMPFKYSEYESDYGIIAYDLTPSHDGNLQFLPIRSKGNVDVNLEFSVNTPAGVILYIGEFRNQLKFGIKTPPRKLFFN